MAGRGQRVSWIHEADFCRALELMISSELDGPVNVCAPDPLTNREFLRAYRQAWKVPLGIPSTAALIRVGAQVMDSEAELLLKSRWVWPARLLDAGFEFLCPTWEKAIDALVQEARLKGHHTR